MTNHDEPRPALAELDDQLLASRARSDDDTIDESLGDLPGDNLGPSIGSVHGEDREHEPMVETPLLDAVDERRVVRVTEQFFGIGQDHQANETAAVRHEGTSSRVARSARATPSSAKPRLADRSLRG